MQITLEKAESILKTLPVSFYLKHGLDVKLDPTGLQTFINLKTEEIHIGFLTISLALEKLPEKTTDDEIERNIRSLLYHEISHALTTPEINALSIAMGCYWKDGLPEYISKYKDEINIFEDERIETIYSDYYLNTDFKKLVFNLNDFDPHIPPTNPQSFFFRIVRFHYGPTDLVNKAKELIKQYLGINRESSWRDLVHWSYNAAKQLEYHGYFVDVIKFYKECESEFNKLFPPQPQEQSGQGQEQSTQENEKEENQEQSGQENEKEENQENLQPEEPQPEEIEEILTKAKEDIKEIISAAGPEYKEIRETAISSLDKYVNKSLENNIKLIISSHKSQKAQNASVRNAYSGVINPRDVSRKDYRWWRKSGQGSNHQYSKKKINLFLDCSGSFYSNETAANQIIKALINIERNDPDFKFDMVRMTTCWTILKGNRRICEADGGNAMPRDCFDIWNKLQSRQYENYNIVLFDGQASSGKIEHERFKVFNHTNTIIISDPENESVINRYCKQAKSIITYSYTKELLDNVLTTLRKICR